MKCTKKLIGVPRARPGADDQRNKERRRARHSVVACARRVLSSGQMQSNWVAINAKQKCTILYFGPSYAASVFKPCCKIDTRDCILILLALDVLSDKSCGSKNFMSQNLTYYTSLKRSN